MRPLPGLVLRGSRAEFFGNEARFVRSLLNYCPTAARKPSRLRTVCADQVCKKIAAGLGSARQLDARVALVGEVCENVGDFGGDLVGHFGLRGCCFSSDIMPCPRYRYKG